MKKRRELTYKVCSYEAATVPSFRLVFFEEVIENPTHEDYNHINSLWVNVNKTKRELERHFIHNVDHILEILEYQYSLISLNMLKNEHNDFQYIIITKQMIKNNKLEKQLL